MTYSPSWLVENAWSNPPRSLSAFALMPLREPKSSLRVFDELGVFAVACRCGGETFQVLGFRQEDGFFAAPLSLKCDRCGGTEEVFDIATHGWDAELGNGCYSIRGSGTPSQYRCPTCEGVSFIPFVGVSYQIDSIEDLDPADQARVQDLFDWFYLDVSCTDCDKDSSVTDYECA